jgi:site-specific DNA recombinase
LPFLDDPYNSQVYRVGTYEFRRTNRPVGAFCCKRRRRKFGQWRWSTNAEFVDISINGGESAKSLDRTRMQQTARARWWDVKAVIVAQLDRLSCSVKNLCELLEHLEQPGVPLISVAESLDTGSAAGRLVLNIVTEISQWKREANRRERATL